MDQPPIEAKYRVMKTRLEGSTNEAKKLLESKTLNQQDRVRLTRVIQLVERYKPARQAEAEMIGIWRKILTNLYRVLPIKQESSQPKSNRFSEEQVGPASFLLSEQIVATLRTLRHLDATLKGEMRFFEDEVLQQERPEKVIEEENLDTSLTLDYERKSWGVERVCLDGIQNHLPADSKGEKVWVRCLVDGQWVGLDEARATSKKISAVRFIDDGVGFDTQNLALLYSTKAGEESSVGQFGEGMKMMAAAALREGLEPEIESQNWRARPHAKPLSLHDTRHGKNKTIEQLSFKVQRLEGDPMFGSRTTFWHPTEAFMQEVFQIDKKVLALREGYRPLFVGSTGQIVDREAGGIYVKGIHVMKKPTIFSYNFDDVETNRDRNLIVGENIEDRIAKIIAELSDKRVIKTLLKKCLLHPNSIESQLDNVKPEHKKVWVEAFADAFGSEAVIDTGFIATNVQRDKTLEKIKFPFGLTRTLLHAGIQSEKDVIPDFYTESLSTSLTLETGQEIWNEERILLDATQNHLPRDSGGDVLGLRFKSQDGKWHNYSELPYYTNEQITGIKIYDNGRGYDHRLLGLIHSRKGDASEASGKFGEGLKMLSVAALRKGIDVTLYSRTWKAKPRTEGQTIEGQVVKQLIFDITHAVKTDTMDNEDNQYGQRSATVFTNPSPKLLTEFRTLNKKVLAIDRPTPVERTENGDILSLEGGLVYVRDVLMAGDHRTMFSYHLSKLPVKIRDRNFIPPEELGPTISSVLAEIYSPEAIRAFLYKANLEAQKWNGKERLEFTLSFLPKHPEVWKKIFEEIFGKEVAIRDVHSQDFDAMHQNQHVGLELITFPSAVYDVLKSLDLPTYESRLNEMTDVEHIPQEALTAAERSVVDFLHKLDRFLPNDRASKIVVYKAKNVGQKVAAGFSDQVNIYLHRQILASLETAADVYVHEKTHHNTQGASDASSRFRNYLTMALAKMVLEQLKEVRPDLITAPVGN